MQKHRLKTAMVLGAWLVGLGIGGAASGAKTWQDYLNEGRQAYQKQDFGTAASAFRLAKNLCPPDQPLAQKALVAQWLGRTYFEQQRYNDAAAELEEALRQDPQQATTHLWLGYTYTRQERLRLAVRHLRQVLESRTATPGEQQGAQEWLISLHEPPELVALEPELELETEAFHLKHHAGDPATPQIAEALQRAHGIIATDLGLSLQEPVEVVVFRDAAEYHQYHLRRGLPRPDWSVACTVNGRVFTFSGQSPLLLQTLIHEYTHVALRLATQDRLPPCWLDEGLACLVARQFLTYRQDVRRAYQNGNLLPIEALTVASFGIYEGDRAYLAYAQSTYMAEVLVQRFGAAGLYRILGGIAAGKEADQAFIDAIGLSQAQYLWAWTQEMLVGK